MTIIEIRPFRNGWSVFEAPGVEPVFLDQEDAISYAEDRACFRSGEIRILGSSGAVERIIEFNEAGRTLRGLIARPNCFSDFPKKIVLTPSRAAFKSRSASAGRPKNARTAFIEFPFPARNHHFRETIANDIHDMCVPCPSIHRRRK